MTLAGPNASLLKDAEASYKCEFYVDWVGGRRQDGELGAPPRNPALRGAALREASELSEYFEWEAPHPNPRPQGGPAGSCPPGGPTGRQALQGAPEHQKLKFATLLV